MNINKLSGITQMALLYGQLISNDTFRFITGQEKNSVKWFILIRYYGELETLKEKYGFKMKIINANFAYIYIDQMLLESLSDETNIIYIELPVVLNYILDENFNAVCLTNRVYSTSGFNLSGKDTIIGIIDSGIDYFHKDFRNADGTTRILSIWDQTDVTPAKDCECGIEYTREQINEALSAPTQLAGLDIVPSTDVLGHGTAMAGIAAGNGNGSNGKYVGVAPESELIIVKVGSGSEDSLGLPIGPNIAQVILGINYILKQGILLNKPVSINIGLGLNEGLHDGENSLEVYIGQASLGWKTNIVVGMGNQGNKDNHTSGAVTQDSSKTNDIFIDVKQPYYFLTVVYGIEDTIGIEVKAPNGETTGRIDPRIVNQGVLLGSNSVIVNFIGPNTVSSLHQINVLIDKYEGEEVAAGVWQVILYGDEIVTGNYHIWGVSIDPLQRLTRFLNPDPYTTLTIPSTSNVVTSVGAFNGLTKQIATFSGRGYPLNKVVKPDFVAPGINVIAPTSLSDNGYATVSGTSASSAFTTGAYALMHQYGMEKKPTAYLYGEALKSIMIKAASRPTQNGPYPNPSWGYGIMCVEKALDILKEQYNA